MDKKLIDLKAELVALFARHGVSVAVGQTKEGVAIRSHDKRVDAVNIISETGVQ